MIKKKRIIISIDHKWRDLPSACYLKLLFEQSGHSVKLVRDPLIEYYIDGVNPHVVIFAHLYNQSRQKLAKKLKKRNIKVFLLPTEGIPTLETYREFASGLYNDLSGVETQFCWNNEMSEIVIKNKSLKSVKTVGCPRFDFYNSKLNQVFKTKSELLKKYNLNPKLKTITFATNFTQAQFYEKNHDFYIKDSKTLGYDNVKNENHIKINDIPISDHTSRDITMKFFLKALDKFTNYNFILKIHPSEDFIYYKNFVKKYCSKYKDRVALVNKEYIWDILNISSLQFSRSCTTAVEAWLLDLPTVELRLNKNEWYVSKEFSSGSFLADSEELAFKIIQDLEDDIVIPTDLKNKRNEFFNKWCYKIDGRSTNRIVENIELTLKENFKPKFHFNFFNLTVFFMLIATNDMIHNLRIYGLPFLFGKKNDQLGRQDKYINNNDIKIWMSKLNHIL